MAANLAVDKQYRLHVQYKNWIGKPDPCGHGKFYQYHDDPSALHEKAVQLERRGNKVLGTEKNVDGNWVRM
jgi:hypothetical protein